MSLPHLFHDCDLPYIGELFFMYMSTLPKKATNSLRVRTGSYTFSRYKNEILTYKLSLVSLESILVISSVHISD